MREIKFRAWWKEAKIMVEVKCLRDNGSIEFFVPVSSGEKKWNELEVLDEPEQYELMQFTGLKDKNGKEIYEGDVVRAKGDVVGSIVFFNGAFMWTDGACHWQMVDWQIEKTAKKCEWAEIIGNRFENPELLKVKEDN